MDQKFYRIKDVNGFSKISEENRKLAEYINGRNFYVFIDQWNTAAKIKLENSEVWVDARDVVETYGTWFTTSEIKIFLEEVPETGDKYFVIAYDAREIVTHVVIKSTLDDAKEAAKYSMQDNNTVVITKTILTAKKDVVFE